MGKSTISMAIFKFANCKRVPEGIQLQQPFPWLDHPGSTWIILDTDGSCGPFGSPELVQEGSNWKSKPPEMGSPDVVSFTTLQSSWLAGKSPSYLSWKYPLIGKYRECSIAMISGGYTLYPLWSCFKQTCHRNHNCALVFQGEPGFGKLFSWFWASERNKPKNIFCESEKICMKGTLIVLCCLFLGGYFKGGPGPFVFARCGSFMHLHLGLKAEALGHTDDSRLMSNDWIWTDITGI